MHKKFHSSVPSSSLLCSFKVRVRQADMPALDNLVKTYTIVTFEYFMDYSKANGMSNGICQAMCENTS